MIIENHKELMGIEVKYKEKIKEKDLSGLKAFKRMYGNIISTLFLINTGQQLVMGDIQMILPFQIQKMVSI